MTFNLKQQENDVNASGFDTKASKQTELYEGGGIDCAFSETRFL